MNGHHHRSLWRDKSMIRTIWVRIYVAPLWRSSMKRVAWTIKLVLFVTNTQGYMSTYHGESVRRNQHGRRRIHGWGVVSRVRTHLSIGSWKSITGTGSIRGEVPTSHHKSRLRDTTHIKWRHRNWGHGAPRSNARIHISGPRRGLKWWRHINREMTRDPRCRLCHSYAYHYEKWKDLSPWNE